MHNRIPIKEEEENIEEEMWKEPKRGIWDMTLQ